MPNSPEPSGRDDWTTPQDFYDRINREFDFTLDAAATAFNRKAPLHLNDAFRENWTTRQGAIFCNHPYGAAATPAWVARAAAEFALWGNTTVLLSPAAVETRWFHNIAAPYAQEIRLIKGRLKFGNVLCKDGTIGETCAPFPSALIIFTKRRLTFGRSAKALIRTWDWRTE